MRIREGLSFSDYFDDSVPADVKPPANLTPMQEEEAIRQDAPQSDYPTETKDLFKGLWEDTTNKDIFMESMMPNDMETFKTHLVQLFAYLQKELQLKTVPDVKLVSDDKNADKVLGKTAYYDPNKKLIVLYVTNRHQKDILRSFAHEVIHHWQHENGKLSDKKSSTKDPQYAQKDPWMRQMEKQAYLLGNILFRDWEDQKKAKDRESGKKMATNEVKHTKAINYWVDKNGKGYRVPNHPSFARRQAGERDDDTNAEVIFDWMYKHGWLRAFVEDDNLYLDNSSDKTPKNPLSRGQRNWVKEMQLEFGGTQLHILDKYGRPMEL